MGKPISIGRFIKAIRALPADEPQVYPKKRYATQKEHWLGWLCGYYGPGVYGRNPETRRDAEYVYNHIVEVKMLLWLIEAAGIEPELVSMARAVRLGNLLLFNNLRLFGSMYRGSRWKLHSGQI